jgi:hypothetical protein
LRRHAPPAAGSSARTVAYDVAPRGVPRALGHRPFHGGEVLVEYAPHELDNWARPGSGIDEGENLKIAGLRLPQRRRRLGPRAGAYVVDVVGAFRERIDASGTMEIDVEDDILRKRDLWPTLRAQGPMEDRREAAFTSRVGPVASP